MVFPVPAQELSDRQQKALIQRVLANVTGILNGSGNADSCSTCKSALTAAKPAALYAPRLVPDAMTSLCKKFGFKSDEACENEYTETAFGVPWTQVLYYADVQGSDGDYICYYLNSDVCGQPQAPLNTTNLFPKPKPADTSVPKPSGERIKVLHLSDIHLDPRYSVGSEANCTNGMCCRTNLHNAEFEDQVVLPASAYGAYKCDTPYDLTLAALEALAPLTGTGEGEDPLAFTLYTGDLVSHDSPAVQIDRAYTQYTETSVFGMLKSYLTGPVFAALGNHDTSPENISPSHKLPGPLGQQNSWNYEHLAGLWQHGGWISPETAAEASTHYGGYSVKTHYGLRVITFNTGMRKRLCFMVRY